MDAWLTAIDSDHSGRSARQKVLSDKPAGLTDGCFLSATDLVHQTLTDPGTGQCGTRLPGGVQPAPGGRRGPDHDRPEVQPQAAELPPTTR